MLLAYNGEWFDYLKNSVYFIVHVDFSEHLFSLETCLEVNNLGMLMDLDILGCEQYQVTYVNVIILEINLY